MFLIEKKQVKKPKIIMVEYYKTQEILAFWEFSNNSILKPNYMTWGIWHIKYKKCTK